MPDLATQICIVPHIYQHIFGTNSAMYAQNFHDGIRDLDDQGTHSSTSYKAIQQGV